MISKIELWSNRHKLFTLINKLTEYYRESPISYDMIITWYPEMNYVKLWDNCIKKREYFKTSGSHSMETIKPSIKSRIWAIIFHHNTYYTHFTLLKHCSHVHLR